MLSVKKVRFYGVFFLFYPRKPSPKKLAQRRHESKEKAGIRTDYELITTLIYIF